MSDCKQFIQSLRRKLPELVSAKDLVKCGVYRTEQAAYAARMRGKCPPYIRIPSRGIVYPRQGVLDFLENNFHNPKEVELSDPIEPKDVNAMGIKVSEWPKKASSASQDRAK